MTLLQELLNILACPSCKSDLHYDKHANTLTCTTCKRTYPIENDIPILLP